MFIGRNDAKAETPILWPPHVKSWLIGKVSDAGKDWGQEEKGTTEDEMVGWHHQLNGHGFEWTPGVGDGQGGLACCGSWGCKESDTTERLNWTELNNKKLLTCIEHLAMCLAHVVYIFNPQNYYLYFIGMKDEGIACLRFQGSKRWLRDSNPSILTPETRFLSTGHATS